MDIKEIIGYCGYFEPPFRTSGGESPYIVDARGNLFLTIDYAGLEHMDFPRRQTIRCTAAAYICELLNRVHCTEGGAS